MGKIITAHRKENEAQLAENYIRTYILFPSGLLGLLAMIVGILALVYQLFVETYDEWTFLKSSGLMLAGILLGWGQTRYHRYLFRAFPEFWASRMKSSGSRGTQRLRKASTEVELKHTGRGLVPVAYALGIAGLLGLSAWSFCSGSLDYMAVFALPWAGFFWGKLFTWRSVIPPLTGKKHAPDVRNRG